MADNVTLKSETPRVSASGLDNVVAAETALSHVDGEAGRLIVAGYDVEELVKAHDFEGAAAALWTAAGYEPAPSEAEVKRALGKAREAAFALVPGLLSLNCHENVTEGLRTGLSMLADDVGNGNGAGDIPAHIRALGAAAVFTAALVRAEEKKSPVAPDAGAGHAEDFLRMLRDEAPSAAEVEALNAYMVTVADHGMNASTFTARVIASTRAGTISAVVGALCALKGPLHGGAPGPVLDMLDEIGTSDNVEPWLQKEIAGGARLMGFGHRVYRVRDPRADVFNRAVTILTNGNERVRFAREVELAALKALRAAKPGHRIDTNMEYYTAVLLEALGIPRDAVTSVFAMARIAGWTAHVMEQERVGRLIRPQSRYVGHWPEGEAAREDQSTEYGVTVGGAFDPHPPLEGGSNRCKRFGEGSLKHDVLRRWRFISFDAAPPPRNLFRSAHKLSTLPQGEGGKKGSSVSDSIRKDFARQALACELLGSPFTSRVCRLLGERLGDRSRFGARVLGWEGDPQADALPLRAAGGFHALKRQGDAALAAAYPPEEADDEALWAALDAAIVAHDDFLHDFLDSAPQTNEVSRSNAILGAALHVAKRTGLPLAIREIGSSAGLNLGFDAYAYELGAAQWGEPASPVRIEAEWQGALPPLDATLEIASRKGCDLNPLDAGRQADRERMLSYIWPDQTARLARIGAALDMAARSGRTVEKADAAEWVEREFGGAGGKGEVRVLMHTIVWQYLPKEVKARIRAAMEKAGATATKDAPLAWIGVEADAKDAASASIRLRLWPDGTDEELGRADFHGRWARWG